MHNPDFWLLVATFIPLLVVGLVLTPLGGDVRRAATLSVAGYVVSLAMGLWTVVEKLLGKSRMNHFAYVKPMLWSWLPVSAPRHALAHAATGGVRRLIFGMAVDSLTLVFFLLTVLIALLVNIYAFGMVDDRRIRPGWFAWSSLFVFSILSLILSASALEMYAAGALATASIWGMSGAAWRSVYEATVRRIMPLPMLSDACFLLGLCLLLIHCGPAVLTLRQVNGTAPIMAGLSAALHVGSVIGVLQSDGTSRIMGLGWWDWAGILIVLGVSGKASQFPLHTWAVETTPAATPTGALVSGLLIATAGPYMFARLLPLLNLDVRLLAAMIAATTLFIGALNSLASKDIKRGLMWLIIAQAGLAILFLVTSSYVAGLYESIFLALSGTCLFLSAGTVLSCTKGQFDLRLLGGLWRKLPITSAASLLVTTASMGLLLFGRPGIIAGGFDNLRSYGAEIGEYGNLLFWIPLFSCYLVLIGLTRWWWLVFGGSWRGADELPSGESAVRLFPMALLALGSLVCGEPLLGMAGLLAKSQPQILMPGNPATVHVAFATQMAERLAWAWPAAFCVVAAFYFSGLGRAEKLRRLPGPNLVYRWLDAEMFFYDFYSSLTRVGVQALAMGARVVDRWIIGWLVVTIALLARLASIVVAAVDWRLTCVAAPPSLIDAAAPSAPGIRGRFAWIFPAGIVLVVIVAVIFMIHLAGG